MDAHLLVDACQPHGVLEYLLGASGAIGTAVLPFEQELLGAELLEVSAELLQNARREWNVPVLFTLGTANVDLHVAGIDVRDAQVDHLTHSQT